MQGVNILYSAYNNDKKYYGQSNEAIALHSSLDRELILSGSWKLELGPLGGRRLSNPDLNRALTASHNTLDISLRQICAIVLMSSLVARDVDDYISYTH